jgi:glutathione S-transferase
MVMYANVPLNNVMYDAIQKEDGSFDASEWFSKKPELKLDNALINLPYVIDGGKVISQSNACMSYLGRKLGLWGRTLEEKCDCEQLLCELMDLRDHMTDFAYGGGKPFDVAKATALISGVQGKNGILHKLELWLERKVTATPEDSSERDEVVGNGTFLVGDHATAPDFHLHELLVQYTALAAFSHLPPFLANYPRLAYFKESFEKLPGMARYLASNIGSIDPLLLPFNNKMASFGADVSGGPWVQGTAYEFNKFTGIY